MTTTICPSCSDERKPTLPMLGAPDNCSSCTPDVELDTDCPACVAETVEESPTMPMFGEPTITCAACSDEHTLTDRD